ncbi:hypothetical protein N7533_012455 [Penicillium manginii]|uniref:uncharacterized protein n=1 Tax=Penicillium manginii TaxID=203109 RepID=UPI002547905B|nr:uncharacterized protein N7533_012455 [Penicillium manginii]KAJ5739671.1 hypothetical protein N7533_012455 [Penicillium manginii]
MQWPAYPRKQGFDNMKSLMNQAPWSAWLATAHHLLAIASAVVIAALNTAGLWVGKELTGTSGQDTEKLLALQFAAKLHELLILSSLGQILFSETVKQLVFGEGLPFGAIAAGLQFNQISYLWSKEFRATSCATFKRKYYIIPAIIICTLLGVGIGPSSATAIKPTLGDWPAGETSFWLNATAQELWPSTLSLTGNENCTNSPETCGSLGTWTSLANNLFKYWGHEALGNIRAMPESVQIPGKVSIRTLNSRFRGPFSLYQPEFTTATVQPAAIANVVNTIRQIWLRANGARCYSGGGSIREQNFCTYKDITWSVDALQPAVYVACNGASSTATPEFPTLASGTDQPTLVEHPVNLTNVSFESAASSITWVDLSGQELIRASVGALVTPIIEQTLDRSTYACTIDAQWANVTIESSFLGLPYIVNGVPPNWYQPQDDSTGRYHGRHVKISPAWASLVNPSLITAQNTSSSPFDILLAAATSSDGESQYMPDKIEAIIAVLIADRMARVGADATFQGTITNINQVLQINDGQLFTAPPSDSQYHRLTFQTAVTGFAYGLRGTTGIITSTLVSIIILLCYVAIAVTHVLYSLCISGVFISQWRNVIDLVALAFHSDITNISSMHGTSTGIETTRPLKIIVVLRPTDRHIEMVFDKEEGSLLGKSGEHGTSDNSTPNTRFKGVRHHSV